MHDESFPVDARNETSPYASPMDSPTEPEVPAGLALAALALPVFTGIASFFVTSLTPSLLLSGATVVTTAVLLAIDAHRLGHTNRAGQQPESPALLLVAMLLLWIVVYPLAFFRRSRFGGPKLGIPAIGVALFFAAGPFVFALVQPAELPSCTDPMVVDLVEQSLRGTPSGHNIVSIDTHKEIRFDENEQVRLGACLVHTSDKMKWYPCAGQF